MCAGSGGIWVPHRSFNNLWIAAKSVDIGRKAHAIEADGYIILINPSYREIFALVDDETCGGHSAEEISGRCEGEIPGLIIG